MRKQAQSGSLDLPLALLRLDLPSPHLSASEPSFPSAKWA